MCDNSTYQCVYGKTIFLRIRFHVSESAPTSIPNRKIAKQKPFALFSHSLEEYFPFCLMENFFLLVKQKIKLDFILKTTKSKQKNLEAAQFQHNLVLFYAFIYQFCLWNKVSGKFLQINKHKAQLQFQHARELEEKKKLWK